MNAAETIAAAIQKLETLTDGAFPGPWEAVHTGAWGGNHAYVLADQESILSVSANDGYDEEYRTPTADLVVTLHRTIDAQLTILRLHLDHLTNPEYDHEEDEDFERDYSDILNLAHAILGEAS